MHDRDQEFQQPTLSRIHAISNRKTILGVGVIPELTLDVKVGPVCQAVPSLLEVIDLPPDAGSPLFRSIPDGGIEHIVLLQLPLSDQHELLDELLILEVPRSLHQSCTPETLEVLLQHSSLPIVARNRWCHVPQGYMNTSMLGCHLSNRTLRLGKVPNSRDATSTGLRG